MALQRSYGTSGADTGYGPTEILDQRDPTGTAVLTQGMALQRSYGTSGADIAYGPTEILRYQ
eukprot:3668329-Rhodomonas_salina.1